MFYNVYENGPTVLLSYGTFSELLPPMDISIINKD